MYGKISFEEKYISRFTIALDFKKRTSPSPRERPWVRGSVVYTQIYRVHKSIYSYTSIYFVEVVYVRISQYIRVTVYTQICKSHTSIYEYILC